MPRRLGLLLLAGSVACSDTTGLGQSLPELDPGPWKVDFGAVYLGGARTLEVPLQNRGAGPLVLGPVVVSDPAFLVLDQPTSIYAGNTGVLRLRFSPIAVGGAEALLELASDDPGGLRVLTLVGEGLAPLDCDDREDCTLDTFDPNAGTCGHEDREGDCDDGSGCTQGDRCAAGRCLGEAIRCDDGEDCTDDLCDPTRGCVQVPVDERCADQDPCSLDRCTSSGCENPPAPDGHPCGPVVSCISAEICLLQQCVEVSIPEGAPCNDGEVCTRDDHCQAETCVGERISRPPQVIGEATLYYNPTSGSLHDDRLYLATPIRALADFKVLAFDGDHVAPLHTWPEANGSAELTRVGPGILARVSTGSTSQRWLEVFDASDPDRPRRTARHPVGYWDRSDDTLLNVAGRVYFCAAPAPLAAPELMEADLLAGAGPVVPVGLGTLACHESQTGFAAAGDVWISFDNQPAQHSAGFMIFRISPGQATSLYSFGFATNGVHQYGGIQEVATDGHVVVIDLENERYLRLVDLDRAPVGITDHLVSNLPQSRLLSVQDRRALYEIRDAWVEVDLNDSANPTLLPDRIAFTPPRSARFLAEDSTRVVLWNSYQGLFVLSRTPTGLSRHYQARGNGAISSLRLQPSGLLFSGRFSMGFVTEAALLNPNLATAADARLFFPAGPYLLTGPDGPAGVVAPLVNHELELCSTFNWGCDRTQPAPLPGPALARLAQVKLDRDGTLTATASQIQMSTEHGAAVAGEDCLGAGLDSYLTAERYVVFDNCQVPGELTVVASIAATIPSGGSSPWARTVHHGPGLATFVGRGFQVLFDYRQPLAPVVLAERFVPTDTVEGFLGVAFDGTHWVSTRIDENGQVLLEVSTVALGTSTVVGSVVFDPQLGVPHRNVLGLQWPLLYIGADHEGASRLLVFDLSGPTPRSLSALELTTSAIDLVVTDQRIYLARPDGLMVLDPACGP
ncbi:MAG: hypothetical protein IPG45_37380 [Deltaproteobacteria bacterium]|nr:hypothetical protein [Deltaproteobacteria bacterium]